MGRLGLAYRTTDQEHCPHDAKLKMAGFKDRYECTRCQKIIPYDPSKEENNKNWKKHRMLRYHQYEEIVSFYTDMGLFLVPDSIYFTMSNLYHQARPSDSTWFNLSQLV